MLDGRVLAAVLASVAAIAAAINGGGIAPSSLKSNSLSAPGDSSFNQIVPDSLEPLKQFMKNPEPENDLKASLVAEDISDEVLKVRKASVTSENFTSISFGGKNAVSDQGITVYGFSGKIEPDDESKLEGSASGFTSSGVNISGQLRVKKELETDMINLENIKRTRLSLEEATGTIEANSSSTELKEVGKVKINSFSGDMRIYPDNGTVLIDGKVDRLEAGSFSFGG